MEDYQKVWMLLDIIHKAAVAGPNFLWFGQQAANMLMEIQATTEAKNKPTVVQPTKQTMQETSHV
jgi:hypothetical protein